MQLGMIGLGEDGSQYGEPPIAGRPSMRCLRHEETMPRRTSECRSSIGGEEILCRQDSTRRQ